MTLVSKFAGKCRNCGNAIPVGTRIEWSRDGGARHLTLAECEVARQASAAAQIARVAAGRPAVETVNMKPVVDFLEVAKANGKKFPKARFLAADGKGELRLSIAGAQSKAPGSVQVVFVPADAPAPVARPRYGWRDDDAPRTDVWLGRIESDGTVVGKLAQDTATLAILRAIVADPAKAAAEYGRITSRCSFCDTKLTDDRSGASVDVGYGPICAKRYGLPWNPKGATKTLKPIPTDGDEPSVGYQPEAAALYDGTPESGSIRKPALTDVVAALTALQGETTVADGTHPIQLVEPVAIRTVCQNEVVPGDTLRIGDTVIWKGAWGSQAPLEAVVTGIDEVVPGEKHGAEVTAMAWARVADSAVVSLANGHWAYGYQIAKRDGGAR